MRGIPTTRAALHVCALALSVTFLTACASDDDVARGAKPYKVVLMPVEGVDEIPLRSKDAGEDDPLAYSMDPGLLKQRIRDAVLASGSFSHVESWEDNAGRGGDERLEAAAEFARGRAADLILRIGVNSAGITDLGPNSRKYWSTFTWFMIPAPIWFVDDRTYDTDLELRAEFYTLDDLLRPAAGATVKLGEQELDLWDRTDFEAQVLVLPPAFLAGDLDQVSETLTERAVTQVVELLVAELRELNIPARFELEASLDGSSLRVDLVTRRPLRSLEVFIDGARASGGSWSEEDTTAIFAADRSGRERLVYEARVAIPSGNARAQIRVVAEDEAGVREVRTLVVGGER